jgi:hypothetical protein
MGLHIRRFLLEEMYSVVFYINLRFQICQTRKTFSALKPNIPLFQYSAVPGGYKKESPG